MNSNPTHDSQKQSSQNHFEGPDVTNSSFAADDQEKTRVTDKKKVIQPPKHADL